MSPAETGARFWQFKYPTVYKDRYGYNNGQRCSPVIDGDRVYVFGAAGMLRCLKLASGEVVWKYDLNTEMNVPQNFFGVGSTPLIDGELLIVNVGAEKNSSVVAFDKLTGKQRWACGDWVRVTRRRLRRRSTANIASWSSMAATAGRPRAGCCASIPHPERWIPVFHSAARATNR